MFGVAIRHPKRRSREWLPLSADRGVCSRLGWYTGFQVLDAVTSEGVVTGFGYGPASVKDQALAETFLEARAQPQSYLLSVGDFTEHPYLTDKGFPGRAYHWRCAVAVWRVHSQFSARLRPTEMACLAASFALWDGAEGGECA
jgi:hypothetical protein